MLYDMEQPFGQFRKAVVIVSTPNLQLPASLLWGAEWKTEKGSTNQNHRSIVVAIKKVNSIPTRPSPASKSITDWNLSLVFLPVYQGIICYGYDPAAFWVNANRPEMTVKVELETSWNFGILYLGNIVSWKI